MFNIAIPTHRRHSVIKKLTLSAIEGIECKSIKIFVSDDDDYNLYRQELPDYEIIICSTTNVRDKFNFIQSYYDDGEFVMVIEDDIAEIQTIKGISVSAAIKFIYQYCLSSQIKSFGVYPSSNKFFMSKSIEIGLTYLVANLFGFVSTRDNRLLCSLPTKNDYERSVKYSEVYGKVARFNFVSCRTNNYGNKGGMQVISNRAKLEDYASEELCKLYPDIFSINLSRKSKYKELKMNKKCKKINL
jgi:hypothetical protein